MATTSNKKMIYTEVFIKKSLVILLFSAILIPNIYYDFEVLKASQQGGVLSILGFLMAAGIMGAFELSYMKSNLHSRLQRYLAHLSKFLLYLATCILIWIGYITMEISGGYYNDWIFIAATLILLSLFVFDVWDIVCAIEKQFSLKPN